MSISGRKSLLYGLVFYFLQKHWYSTSCGHKVAQHSIKEPKVLFVDKVLGVKPLIHQSELRTYKKVVTFQEKSSFHFVVL
jgi:hypothetical protein